jgi:hypothetical protein
MTHRAFFGTPTDGLRGKVEAGEIILAIALKKSLRSDRL